MLTIGSDNNGGTNELSVASGATLKLASNFALGLAFSGTGATSLVSGTLELSTTTGTAVLNTINFTNSVTTVDVSGTLAAGGNASSNGVFTSSITNLLINGTYNHKYTTLSGSALPTASWNDGSVCLISGYTTSTGGPNGGASAQNFYDFVYNCPSETVASQWSGEFPGTVRNSLKVISTGTSEWQWTTIQAFSKTINNYIQTGGTVNTSTGASGAKALNVTGSFTQSGGIFKNTGTILFTLNFSGAAGTQNVSFADAAPVGPFVYQISNPINLAGTGALTSTFNINTSGGLRVSTTNAAPLITSLALNYFATGTTLTYDAAGSYSATPIVFPLTGGPFNLMVAVGAGNALTVPFDRSVGGTTTLTTGDINLAANNYTVGTAGATAGTLTPNSGVFRITTGTLSRWYNTSGLPTAVASSAGNFPLLIAGADRSVSVYFSTATAVSTAGTISVGHTNIAGSTTGLSIADGPYTIETRLNSYWTINAGNGLATSGTIAARVTAGNLFNSSNIANVRLMKVASVPGTHVNGTGSYPAAMVYRAGLVASDLSGNFYAGAAAADINTTVYTAINTGNWSTGTTWDLGTQPNAGSLAVINNAVTVTTDGANQTGTLVINAGAVLNINSNSLTLSDAVTNNGTLNLGGGTLTIGPAGGSNKSLTNNSAAALTVSAGTLNLNGSLNNVSGSSFTQSGGSIIVDGNAASVTANSVAAGTAIVSFKSNNLTLTGGTFTIVDPHTNSTASNTFEYNNGTLVNAGTGHTFIFGDAVSTDSSANSTNAFRVNVLAGAAKFAFGNLIINSYAIGSNRFITQSTSFGVAGNFTVNANAEFRNGSGLYVAGNIVNNGTFTSIGTTGVLFFASYSGTAQTAAPAAQTISGSGLFRNAVSATPTANFVGVTHQNNFGITYNIGDFKFSGTMAFAAANGSPTKVIIPTGKMIEIAGAGNSASATNGWVVGTYQKAATTGGISHTYPLGTMTAYTPLGLSSASGTAVLTAGSIAASVYATDHPDISNSGVDPLKSVNLYWNIQQVGGITFAPGVMTVTPTWTAANVDAGANTANFKGAFDSLSNGWKAPATGTPTATSIALNGLGAIVNGDYQVGEIAATIPVRLVSFFGERKGSDNKLTWITGTELNNTGFYVERSIDGQYFSSLQFIPTKAANGNSNTDITYSFVDSRILLSNNYYRLKQVDKDGRSEYSNVVLLRADKSAVLSIAALYPNPAADHLTISVLSPKDSKLNIEITDIAGRIISRSVVMAITGDNKFALNLQSLGAGNYSIKVIADDNQTAVTKFTKL